MHQKVPHVTLCLREAEWMEYEAEWMEWAQTPDEEDQLEALEAVKFCSGLNSKLQSFQPGDGQDQSWFQWTEHLSSHYEQDEALVRQLSLH